MQHHLAGDAGVDLGHLARFALQVAEDQRGDTGGAGHFGGGVERLLRRGDQLEVAAREQRVARLERLRARVLEPGAHVGRHLDVVARENFQRLRRGGRVGHGRPGGDHRSFVARYIGDRVGVHAGRPAGLGQAAALDRREVLAHAVHLADVRAGAQQRLVDRLLVGQRNAFGRQRQQRGAAAGEQEDHPVAFLEVADQLQHAAGDALAGVVRHRVRGFHHLDLAAVGAVLVAGHHQPGNLAFPDLFDGFGHGGGSLAGANDDGAAAAILGQPIGQHLARVGGVDGTVEQLAQQGVRGDGHMRAPFIWVCADSSPQGSIRQALRVGIDPPGGRAVTPSAGRIERVAVRRRRLNRDGAR